MAGNRKAAESLIMVYIKKIDKSGYNTELYTALFKDMSAKEFDNFMIKLSNKELTISVIAPINSKVKLSTDNNFKIAKELGFDFFQRLEIGPKGSKADGTYIPKYTTNIKYLVYDLPFRRTAQLLTKAVSVGSNNNVIDLTTGQVTGDSRSAKLTKPELEILVGMGLDSSIKELMKVRGGDTGAARVLDASIARTGSASQEVINEYATGVESTKTLKSYFLACHLKSTL